MKILKFIAFLLVFSACGMVSNNASGDKVKKAKSFTSITVGERSGLVGQSSLVRLLDDGRYLVVNAKGNWDTIGAVEPLDLEKAAQMLERVKSLEVKSLGDGDEGSIEYKVEANLKPEGYVYYLWPKGREKVPQDLQDLFLFIKQIDPRLKKQM
jgi:hypothetical protein